MFTRSDLKNASKEQLRGQWFIAGGLFIVLTLVAFGIAIIPIIGWIAALFIPGAILLGKSYAMLKLTKEQIGIGDAFFGFNYFWKAFALYFIQAFFTALWSMLFVIPGIIKSYSYSMAFYAMADDFSLTAREALNESKRITKGYKLSLFILELSFIGWEILASLSFGIGFFWLVPYKQLTYANAYKALKENYNYSNKVAA